MRTRSLLSQVLAVNTALVAATAIVAAVLAPDHTGDVAAVQRLLLIALAVVSAVLLNSLLLKRRLAPLDRLLQTMERVDLASPGQRACAPHNAPREIERLTADFNRMLARLEEERVESGRAVIRAQEEERARIAQDLHDEVNQALTAILLRLQAVSQDAPPEVSDELAEVRRLVNQAMDELLRLARQLRPTALDDHGLYSAIEGQVRRFSTQTGIDADLRTHGDQVELDPDREIAVFRVAQEALANIARHAGASSVEVDVTRLGDHGVALTVRDDGRGFSPEGESNGLGLNGMAERARLVGGELEIESRPGGGTALSLKVP
jgi:two-component system, NarL family, sensor histidine kinase UhpB